MFDSFVEASTLIPRSNSVGEKLKEVTFSLLKDFITSKKKDWPNFSYGKCEL